ncbi:MAG: N-formylglutamate amidohydrolase [Rhodobacteraceae bacterium]|nr:MAG: N-formylglutamate amidohydrolase [Paracoccaceae bacterium]
MRSYEPFQITGRQRPSNIVFLCDHASNIIPDEINDGDLGLPQADMDRHIAFDIGILGFAKALAEKFDAPLIVSNFSRLVIDPNRAEDDPTLVMQLYDGSIIPANRDCTPAEKSKRLDLCYRPYHDAAKTVIDERENPVVISLHSFTKQLNGYAARPWHVGVLYAHDKRLAQPLMHELSKDANLCVADNEPYTGRLIGDTMDRHALSQNRHHALIEVRNDLIETQTGQHKWAQALMSPLTNAIAHATKE